MCYASFLSFISFISGLVLIPASYRLSRPTARHRTPVNSGFLVPGFFRENDLAFALSIGIKRLFFLVHPSNAMTPKEEYADSGSDCNH